MKRERAEPRSGSEQPDPMKTAFGYIGADSFLRQRQSPGQPRAGRPAAVVRAMAAAATDPEAAASEEAAGDRAAAAAVAQAARAAVAAIAERHHAIRKSAAPAVKKHGSCVKSDHWPHADFGAPELGRPLRVQ